MNKIQLISKIARTTGLTNTEVRIVIDNFLYHIQENLLNNQEVQLKGFGKFYNKKRLPKVARNLTDNTAMTIAEHHVPVLKMSKNFVNKIKNDYLSKHHQEGRKGKK